VRACMRIGHCAALIELLRRKRIVFNSYSPFGGGGNDTAALLADPRLRAIGSVHNATTAQVILNWQWRNGVVFNPQVLSRPLPFIAWPNALLCEPLLMPRGATAGKFSSLPKGESAVGWV
jgi:hypothetical protein